MRVDAELLGVGSRQPDTDGAALATSGTPGPGSDSEALGPQLGATLGEALAGWAATRSEAPALPDATATAITYGDLLSIVRGIGCALARQAWALVSAWDWGWQGPVDPGRRLPLHPGSAEPCSQHTSWQTSALPWA